MKKRSAAEINARGFSSQALNAGVRAAAQAGTEKIILRNVCGQRYIGAGLMNKTEIIVEGTPGNDLACFMDGPRVVVHGNAQDAAANTMSSGELIIHGDAGDVPGYSMRGGRLFIRGDAGYRVGIHMKAYANQSPVIVIGGNTKDYLGEYMAGGTIVVLGLNQTNGTPLIGDFVGTGMHGGEIFLRGAVNDCLLGRETGIAAISGTERSRLTNILMDFAGEFNMIPTQLTGLDFIRLGPVSCRPYGRIYVY
ncbi:MAG: hypothetical protein PHP98_06245 [Kiritimatiellae bacterium]|nr:hypothetical protein [Kiritimatiellia bacterium]